MKNLDNKSGKGFMLCGTCLAQAKYIKSIYVSSFTCNFIIYAVMWNNNLLLSPTGKPNQPINVTCEGRLNSVNVNWKSGFNGGKNQTFTIYYKRNDYDGNSEWTAFVTTYSDPGQNMYTSAEIQPLEAGASFVFQVYASNEYSYSVSESSYCNTSEAGMYTTPPTACNSMIYI